MKLTTITKTTGVAWIHAAADRQAHADTLNSIVHLSHPDRRLDINLRWTDPESLWAKVAHAQLKVMLARAEAIYAAQHAAFCIKELEALTKAAQSSNDAL